MISEQQNLVQHKPLRQDAEDLISIFLTFEKDLQLQVFDELKKICHPTQSKKRKREKYHDVSKLLEQIS